MLARQRARRPSTGTRLPAGPTASPISTGLRRALAGGGSREPFLYAFDLLELEGEDLRPKPSHARPAALAHLVRRRRPGHSPVTSRCSAPTPRGAPAARPMSVLSGMLAMGASPSSESPRRRRGGTHRSADCPRGEPPGGRERGGGGAHCLTWLEGPLPEAHRPRDRQPVPVVSAPACDPTRTFALARRQYGVLY